ncbi:MAG: purine-nucleoside phosphorylase [Anaerolineaceae bacterium 4572_32.1]|nr:MAG: purine-nucleoside phosphorylase [Anaerolineaceae bacterium 4572_32.1]
MKKLFTLDDYRQAADYISAHTRYEPTVGLILGSGLNTLVDDVNASEIIPFGDIPHFPVSTVMGHTGRLVLGELAGHQVIVMQGRAHYYEGYSMDEITLPIRVMHLLGVQTLIVTNAAGGINPAFKAGELMLITDHINFIGMAGNNPLRGPNLEEFGPRFPDMSEAYDRKLRNLALQAAQEHNVPLHQGVYVSLAGPSFETPADLRFLKLMGADAVGMSTVPEVIVARHGGMKVLGISGISNEVLFEPAEEELAHKEVLEIGKRRIVPHLVTIIKGVLAAMR